MPRCHAVSHVNHSIYITLQHIPYKGRTPKRWNSLGHSFPVVLRCRGVYVFICLVIIIFIYFSAFRAEGVDFVAPWCRGDSAFRVYPPVIMLLRNIINIIQFYMFSPIRINKHGSMRFMSIKVNVALSKIY